MTLIKLPDQQTAALKAKATAEGLSLNAWLQKLAEQKRPARHRHITNVILESMQDVPPEIMARTSKDAAQERDRGA
jgi:hypothetical protein